MTNEDIIDLVNRMKLGAIVVVLPPGRSARMGPIAGFPQLIMARRKLLAARRIRATLSGKIDDLQFSSLHAPIFDPKISRVACLAVHGIAFTYQFDSPGRR
jgi:hypothetical protein